MTEKIMDQFKLTGNGETADFLIEAEGFEGIRILAQTVADDVALVTETRPGICSDPSGCDGHVVLMATCGKSSLLECLAGKLPLSSLREKRESYLMQILEDPFPEHPGIHKLLMIAGSDKRGTIYGMFRLSEMCGVSPLVFFGDVIPVKRRELVLSLPGPVISRNLPLSTGDSSSMMNGLLSATGARKSTAVSIRTPTGRYLSFFSG